MHADQVEVGEQLVRALLQQQFPQWADLPLQRFASTGTVNAIYRLGDDLAVRLPLTPNWHHIETEACWLENLRARVSITIPEIVAIGQPAFDYAWQWGVARWLEGEPFALAAVADPASAARELAGIIHAVAAINPRDLPCGKPPGGRPPLVAVDQGARRAAHDSRHLIDEAAFLRAWDAALALPEPTGRVLAHGDLLAGNVLVSDGRISAVIDWAGIGLSDPAREAMSAWMLFDGDSRAAFRDALGIDDAAWERSKGWALTRIFGVAYYEHTNPLFSQEAVRTINAVLAD